MENVEQKRGPGRPPRAETERAQRRRRGDSELARSQRLPIPPEVKERLDRAGLVPRWVNDTQGRIAKLTQYDDYDPVEGVEPIPLGIGPDGQPMKAHLLAKRKDFIEEDRAKAEARRKGTETSLLRGQVPAAPGTNQRPADNGPTYVAEGTNISRGNQVLE